MSALETEIATYNEKLPSLMKHQGKFVVIKGSEIAGTFDSYGDALKLGYDRFGLDHFLVKQITPAEQVSFISRHTIPCQLSTCQ